jgi:hypothetical protein
VTPCTLADPLGQLIEAAWVSDSLLDLTDNGGNRGPVDLQRKLWLTGSEPSGHDNVV